MDSRSRLILGIASTDLGLTGRRPAEAMKNRIRDDVGGLLAVGFQTGVA